MTTLKTPTTPKNPTNPTMETRRSRMTRILLRGWIRRILFLILCMIFSGVLAFGIAIGVVIAGMQGSGVISAECGIVFGAGVLPLRDESGTMIGSKAGPGILRRTETAAALYREGKLKKLFLTGGKGEGMRLSEAAVMRETAIGEGVASQDIFIEDQSTSTRENLINTRPLTAGCTSVLGISDGFHLSRIRFLAWQLGWDLPTYPAGERPNQRFELHSFIREALGILFYSVY